MTRLIDADKLYPDCMTKNGTLAISQNQIANAPTVERPHGEWIPVSERLPEINVDVIVTDVETTGTYEACYLGDGIWECDNGTHDDRIIAWMPFPEPYKDEKSSSLLMDVIEDRCSCCGNPLMQNGGTIIAGRCRTYILCSDCDKRKDEFIKWSDEE